MKVKTGFAAALVLVAGLAGCGQNSFFEVTVRVKNTTTTDISMINSCVVKVSGAATDTFSISDLACSHVTEQTLGTFEYGTTADSGTLSFHVDLLKGDLTKLAQGDNSGPIKAGGRQMVTVEVQ